MRNEPVTMNDFADSVREELQNDLGVLFPGIKVVVQQVDKSKLIAQQQIEKLQMLYDSLAQEYFSI